MDTEINMLSLICALLAIVLSITSLAITPEWDDINNKPYIFSGYYDNLINIPDKDSFLYSYEDTFEGGFNWLNEMGTHGTGSLVAIGTTYYHYGTHALSVYTRSTGGAVGDYEFANKRAAISSDQCFKVNTVRFRGFFERWYNAYTWIVQWEVALAKNGSVYPAEFRYDNSSKCITVKTTNGVRQNVANITLNSAVWHEFECDINFKAGNYTRIFLRTSSTVLLNLDISNIKLPVENEATASYVNFFLGVVSIDGHQCMIWFDDVYFYCLGEQ